ncbi:MAG: T9SS type A sorting domain-containing protein [Bacteroidota bacterium]
MKKYLPFLLISLLGILQLKAQEATIVTDTVSLMPGYADQVWYSMESGEQSRSALDSWDVAFSAKPFSSTIFVNDAKGIELYTYPNGDTAAWPTVDTAGMSAWKISYNADTSWTMGAFNREANAADPFDLGWGTYSMITHFVTGDSLYILKYPNGNIQKLWIQQLASGVYSFRHGTLDGMMDMSHVIRKADFENKNFGYFNLTSHNAVDPEPVNTDWDLLFTRYIAFLPPSGTPYGVSGVLSNAGVEVAQVYPVDDVDTYIDYQSATFGTDKNIIGYDWKDFSFMSGWTLQDSLVYFVKDKAGEYWKIVFTEFDGSSTGNFYFDKQSFRVTNTDPSQGSSFVRLYPNPVAAGSNLSLVTDLPQGQADARYQIISANGQRMAGGNVSLSAGFHQTTLRLPELAQGMYFLQLQAGAQQWTERIIIK